MVATMALTILMPALTYKESERAVVVALLEEWLLPKPKIYRSNPVIDQFYYRTLKNFKLIFRY